MIGNIFPKGSMILPFCSSLTHFLLLLLPMTLNFKSELSPPLVDAKTDFVQWYYSMSFGDIFIMLALFSAVLFVLFKNIKIKLASILVMFIIVYFSFNLTWTYWGFLFYWPVQCCTICIC